MPRVKKSEQKNIQMRGFVKALVLDSKNGKVLGYREAENAIMDNGRLAMADLIVGDVTYNAIGQAHVGSNTLNATALNLTDLQASMTLSVQSAFVKIPTFATFTSAPGMVQFAWTYTNSEYNNSTVGSVFGEVGLFGAAPTYTTNAGNRPVMFARVTFPQTTKTSDMAILFSYQIRFTQ